MWHTTKNTAHLQLTLWWVAVDTRSRDGGDEKKGWWAHTPRLKPEWHGATRGCVDHGEVGHDRRVGAADGERGKEVECVSVWWIRGLVDIEESHRKERSRAEGGNVHQQPAAQPLKEGKRGNANASTHHPLLIGEAH